MVKTESVKLGNNIESTPFFVITVTLVHILHGGKGSRNIKK